MRSFLLGAALVLASAALASPAHATDLMSSAGFLFDFQDGGGGSFSFDGSMSNGSIDAYDGCYYLDVNGIRYSSGGPPTLTLGGRQIEMPEVAVGTLRARRILYVPSSGGSWARYLDVVSNPGTTATTATITISGNLGS